MTISVLARPLCMIFLDSHAQSFFYNVIFLSLMFHLRELVVEVVLVIRRFVCVVFYFRLVLARNLLCKR